MKIPWNIVKKIFFKLLEWFVLGMVAVILFPAIWTKLRSPVIVSPDFLILSSKTVDMTSSDPALLNFSVFNRSDKIYSNIWVRLTIYSHAKINSLIEIEAESSGIKNFAEMNDGQKFATSMYRFDGTLDDKPCVWIYIQSMKPGPSINFILKLLNPKFLSGSNRSSQIDLCVTDDLIEGQLATSHIGNHKKGQFKLLMKTPAKADFGVIHLADKKVIKLID